MKREYSARTVFAAHRRVLKMAVNLVGRMPVKELQKLRTDGKGQMTLSELTEHMVRALNLKVRRKAPRRSERFKESSGR